MYEYFACMYTHALYVPGAYRRWQGIDPHRTGVIDAYGAAMWVLGIECPFFTRAAAALDC